MWTNLPASWGVFVLIAVVAAMLYAVFRSIAAKCDSCPPWVKIAAGGAARPASCCCLACIFLGPALVYLQNRTIQPTIVVARDASQSMNTADRYADEAAAKIVAAALGKSESEIARPGQRGRRSSTSCWRHATEAARKLASKADCRRSISPSR